MNKSFLIFFLFFTFLSSQVFAEKQDWYDSRFDFTKVKSIIINLDKPENCPEIVFKEIEDIFFNGTKEGIFDKLNHKCKVASIFKVKEDILKVNRLSLEQIREIEKTNPKKVQDLFTGYVRDNYDIMILARPIIYDVGTQYYEGYTYTMPSINQSYITFPNGQMATITSNGQTIHTIPGGNFPTVYVCFRFDIFDVKDTSQDKVVWARVDDRARVNRSALENSKPKDVLKRIVSSFSNDFVKTINTKKATANKHHGF